MVAIADIGGGLSSCSVVLRGVALCRLVNLNLRHPHAVVGVPGSVESRGTMNSLQVLEAAGCYRGVDELRALSTI